MSAKFLKDSHDSLASITVALLDVIDQEGKILSLVDELTPVLRQLPETPAPMLQIAFAIAMYKATGYEGLLRETNHKMAHILMEVHKDRAIKPEPLTQEERDKIKVEAAGRSPFFADLLVNGSPEEIELATEVYHMISRIPKDGEAGHLRLESRGNVRSSRAEQIVNALVKELLPGAKIRTAAVAL